MADELPQQLEMHLPQLTLKLPLPSSHRHIDTLSLSPAACVRVCVRVCVSAFRYELSNLINVCVFVCQRYSPPSAVAVAVPRCSTSSSSYLLDVSWR